MPRLSVDIDVVFTDYREPRTEALKDIASGLDEARQRTWPDCSRNDATWLERSR
jgi:hypothetical protein